MNKTDIEAIALAFVVQRVGWELPILGSKQISAHIWHVMFETRDADGTAFESPTLIVVEGGPGKAYFSHEYYGRPLGPSVRSSEHVLQRGAMPKHSEPPNEQ